MNKFFIIILFFFVFNYTKAQVVPIGTIIKTNKLPDIEFNPSASSIINNETVITCSARIIDKGSKATIIEKGFLVRTNYNSTIPLTIENSRKFRVLTGSSNFNYEIIITPQNFPEFNFINNMNLIAYRAYAINSFGQVIYSDDTGSDFVALNHCLNSPCRNGAGCINLGIGNFRCDCPPEYCGDCCAFITDITNSFCSSGENFCNSYYQYLTVDYKKVKYYDSIIKPSSQQKSIWTLTLSNSIIKEKQEILKPLAKIQNKIYIK